MGLEVFRVVVDSCRRSFLEVARRRSVFRRGRRLEFPEPVGFRYNAGVTEPGHLPEPRPDETLSDRKRVKQTP